MTAPVLVLLTAIAAAAAIVLLLDRTRKMRSGPRPAHDATQAVFLFQDGNLVDATPPARALLRLADGRSGDLAATVDLLARRFPGLTVPVAGTGAQTLAFDGTGPGESLTVERWDGFVRLSLATASGGAASDHLRLSSLEEEVATLRAIAEDAPQLIWKEDANGSVIWANRTYLQMADRIAAPPATALPAWPARPIFRDASHPDIEGEAQTRRGLLNLPGQSAPQWFEITRVRRGPHVIGFAVDATGAVAAEQARQTFVQTLTKTFANLKAGLAVFDRQRRLVLFNPAFLDLTGLKAEFLSQRPQVFSVLDRLRDMRMLPEPKNYHGWREQVAALEAAAERGTYCETWVLPAGQTYRVSGRPHPDGALAFLFEDISDEVSLTRHFRLEQETAQAVMDSMPQAIAVFSANGTMTLSNSGYGALWGPVPGGLHDSDLADEIQRWRLRAAPAPVWDRLAGLSTTARDSRLSLTEVLRLVDGRVIRARFAPLPGGSTLAEFSDATRSDGLAIVDELAGAPTDPLRDTGT